MTNKTQKPTSEIRVGNLKAAIWANDGKNGTFYSVTYSRSVKDETTGDYADYQNFTGQDNLAIAYLAERAFSKTQQLIAADRATARIEDEE